MDPKPYLNKNSLAAITRRAIFEALEQNNWVFEHAAKQLEIDPRTLARKARKLEIKIPASHLQAVQDRGRSGGRPQKTLSA